MQEHAGNVVLFLSNVCELPELKNLVELAGILHDAGKLGTKNQDDFKNIRKLGDKVHKHGLDHSTAGGRLALELIKEWPVSEFISTLIYFHHGMEDCINLENGQSLQERRLKKEIEYAYIKEKFFRIYDIKTLKKSGEEAIQSYQKIFNNINEFVKKQDSSGKKYGSRYFYLGMYLRIALSLLIDGDWTDTACFFQNIPLSKRISQEETQEIWQKCIYNFEQYLKNEIQNNPDNGNRLNSFRQEISDSCRKAAETNQKLYRLTVPTGAGKTLSSLRFALYHARKEQKIRIIYIAPFTSILEQNAEEIRKATGLPSVVLEHHCNVICEEGEEEKYRNLTETWDSPIIVTTAVQILNTLFSDQKSCIRRMHNLCNSVIIFDEVQAIPVKCTELFNLAVNFLSQFCGTTVVLCSATQPTLASLEENNICECLEMSGESEKYAKAFKRVEIIDETERYAGGMETEDLRDFALEKTEEYRSTLVIVNTTKCAFEVFQKLEDSCTEEYEIFHLSNNMCPQHKLDTLKEIRNAQAALQKVLDDFKHDKKKFNYALDSEIAIKFYYSVYHTQLRKSETKFPAEIYNVPVTLVDLLGKNQTGRNQYRRKHEGKMYTKLSQAFQTAGHEFEVISDTYKVSVVVPYETESYQLLEELSQVRTETEKKKILRKLQRYMVGISEIRKDKLGNAIYETSEGILVLSDGYYDKKVGVVDEPKMDFCNM
ncbi:CRISPR-associated endonuclease Cas3'' [Blautia schinkii]|uniref:CRISPR-associated endonuclease Cas3'' n=1 Tax=Blautia schinkii TaxID=180164 RepID=UPI001FC8C610|nr:CRISPR-associated endonuclease Cas3'' [Blautia schinkii]